LDGTGLKLKWGVPKREGEVEAAFFKHRGERFLLSPKKRGRQNLFTTGENGRQKPIQPVPGGWNWVKNKNPLNDLSLGDKTGKRKNHQGMREIMQKKSTPVYFSLRGSFPIPEKKREPWPESEKGN